MTVEEIDLLDESQRVMQDLFFSIGNILSEVSYCIERMKNNTETRELLKTLQNENKKDNNLGRYLARIEMSERWLESRAYHQIMQLQHTFNELLVKTDSKHAMRKIVKNANT